MAHTIRYSVTCAECGKRMRVKPKHVGHTARCKNCLQPIYITHENVTPPIRPFDRSGPRYFTLEEVPIHWQPGDLFMDLYLVREKLGEGGMGEVHRVRHRGWGADIAVKSISPRLVKREEQIENFENECELWVNLGLHPNIVTCYYVRRMGAIPRVFMEYLPAGSLLDSIQSGALYAGDTNNALRRILDVAVQVAWGLEHAHRKGALHLDMKPSNVLITHYGGAKVTDYGLSRAFHGDDKGVQEAWLYDGTPPYVAPERADAASITRKCDMWSWALVVLEMFEGKVTWPDGREAARVLKRHLADGAPRDDVAIPPIPDQLADILRQCFEEEPGNRPESLEAVATELTDLYQDTTGSAYGRPVPTADENSPRVLNNSAVSLLDLGRTERAESAWRRALNLQPDHLASRYNLRLMEWRTGRIPTGKLLEEIYSYCGQDSEDWWPFYLLVQILNECGQYERAYEILKWLGRNGDTPKELAIAMEETRHYRTSTRRLIGEFNAHEKCITSVDTTRDGWLALSTSLDGTAKIWELAAEKCRHTLEGHDGEVYAGCISKDEQTVCTGGRDKTVRIWSAESGKCQRTLAEHREAVTAVAIDPEGKWCVSASLDWKLKLWDIKSGKCLHTMVSHTDCVDAIAISANGKLAISGGRDGLVKLWNLDSGKCLRNFDGKTKRVTAVCITEDRSRIVSACRDGRIQIWDTDSGDCIHSFQAHSTETYALKITPDGRSAISASREGTMKLWDLDTGQPLYAFDGHAPVALSKDGRYAISAGEKGTLKFWGVFCFTPIVRAHYALCRAVQTPGPPVDKTDR